MSWVCDVTSLWQVDCKPHVCSSFTKRSLLSTQMGMDPYNDSNWLIREQVCTLRYGVYTNVTIITIIISAWHGG